LRQVRDNVYDTFTTAFATSALALWLGNVTQRRFRSTGNGLLFDNSLNIEGLRLKGWMENGYEEGCARGANKECNRFPSRLPNEQSPASEMRGFVFL